MLEKRGHIFGVLDIGSDSVKFLVLQKQNNKRNVLIGTLEEYECFGVFETRDFERDVIKETIKKAINQAQKEINKQVEDIIIGLSSHILKARIVNQVFERAKPLVKITEQEKQEILHRILEKIKKEILKDFEKETGILARDFQFFPSEILETKIDGYKVSQIIGLNGRQVEFKMLLTFLPRDYLKKIKKIIRELGFKKTKICHPAQGLIKRPPAGENVLILDIGADFTQIFLIKQGNLEMVSEIKLGGKNFSQALCQHFGILYNEAKQWSRKYQKGLFGKNISVRLKQIFSQEAQNWYLSLERKLAAKMFFREIHCFGGAALYSEIEEILEKNFQVPVKILKEPRFQPTLLLSNLF